MFWLILFLVAVLCLLFAVLYLLLFFRRLLFYTFTIPLFHSTPSSSSLNIISPFPLCLVTSRPLGRVIVHVLRGDSEDPLGDFIAINQELELFNPKLADKLQVRCVDHPLDENTSKKISRMSVLSSPLTLSCIMSLLINWHCRYSSTDIVVVFHCWLVGWCRWWWWTRLTSLRCATNWTNLPNRWFDPPVLITYTP